MSGVQYIIADSQTKLHSKSDKLANYLLYEHWYLRAYEHTKHYHGEGSPTRQTRLNGYKELTIRVVE